MNLQQALKVNGKVVHSSFPKDWFAMLSSCGNHLVCDDKSKYHLQLITLLDDNWQPWAKPCKHEPKYSWDLDNTLRVYCKKEGCGIKLKVKEWLPYDE